MTVRGAFFLLAVLVATPVFAAKPQIQWDTEYDFSTIKTFQWQDHAGESLKESDPFLHGHIVNAIEFELSKSGLTEVGPVATTTRVVEVERGTLVVDIWAAARKELIWRGTASDISVSENPDKTRRNAEKAIEAMAKQAKRVRDGK